MNYLYNGVELPALPEWNKKKRPYALLGEYAWDDAFTPILYVFATPPVIDGDSISTGIDFGEYGNWAATSHYKSDINAWGAFSENSAGSIHIDHIVWSNYDLYFAEDYAGFMGSDLAGTLHLAASYPINAETGEEITDYVPVPVKPLNPSAMAMGMLVGQAVRKMRK